jgi:hypothetical protein
VQQRFPSDYDSVVRAFYSSFESGETEARSFAAGREKLLMIVKKLRPLADDGVLSDLGAVYAEQYAALGSKSAALCYQYASGVGNTVAPSDFPDALFQKENDLNRRVVETAKARTPVNSAVSDALWKKVVASMASKGLKSEQFDLLSGERVPAEKYKDYCTVSTLLFREISQLSQSEAGVLMRDVWAEK